MTIYILEDTPTHLRRIEHALTEYHSKIKHISWQTFDKINDLLVATMFIAPEDVFLLDIELNQAPQAGLRVASILQERQPTSRIVFITSYVHHAIDTFNLHIRALDFIDKSVDNIEFFLRLSHVLSQQQQFTEYLAFKIATEQHRMPLSQVLSIETLGNHSLRINTATGSLCIRANLKDFTHHSSLIQISKNTLINKIHVAHFDKQQITLTNSSTLPISRRFYKNIYAETPTFMLKYT